MSSAETTSTMPRPGSKPEVPKACEVAAAAQVRGTSNWVRVWHRFKKNKVAVVSGVVCLILMLAAAFAPVVAPYGYDETNWEVTWQAPTLAHPFGADELGRDMLSRMIWALRNALSIALLAEVVTLIVGAAVGATAGYFGGKIDNFLMRVTDIMFAFPSLLFNIILLQVLGRGLFGIFLSIGVTRWTGMARLVRGQVLQLKRMEYVEAARASGAGGWDIVTRYILPNAMGPIIVMLTLGIPGNIGLESALSLLGMGVRPPMPSWGAMLDQYKTYLLSYPHLLLFPAASLAFTLFAFTFFGDGVSEAFNPKE